MGEEMMGIGESPIVDHSGERQVTPCSHLERECGSETETTTRNPSNLKPPNTTSHRTRT